jgi:hypothetical protein
MNKKKPFFKSYTELIDLGLPTTLVLLYGCLEFHCGTNGKCWPKHSTLAKEVGLKGRKHVAELLDRLRVLRLIEQTRGRYFNTYRVLDPDAGFIRRQMSHTPGISDVTYTRHRKEESSSKKRTKKRTPPTPSARSTEKPGAGTGAKPSTSVFLDDDDPKPERTPEAEFRERLAARHGPRFDVDTCRANVRKQLEKWGVPLADFLAYDAERSTGSSFKNPNGYYVHLAKEVVNAAILEARRSTRRTAEPVAEPPRDAKGRCVRCAGVGKLKDGAYCECQMGRDLAKAERPKPKPEAKAARKGAA